MSRTAVVLAIVLSATAALAQEDAGALDKMVAINRKALDQLKAGKKEEARDALLEAVWLGRQAGLTSHQMMARTYLHLGAVYLTGFGDKEKAVQQLAAAVRLRPTIQLTPALVTPALEEAFQVAQVEANVTPTPVPVTPAPPPRPPHKAPARLALTAAAPSAAVVSAPADPQLKAETTVEVSRSPAGGALWVGLGVGSGVGWHGRRDLEAQQEFVLPAGVGATAVAHLAPEIGYHLTDGLAVSVQSRHQIIPKIGHSLNQRSRFAHAVFVRGHGLLTRPSDTLEVWGTFAAGGGSAFRMYVPVSATAGLGASDTISAGPVAFGPGISLVFRPGGELALVAEARALGAVPRFAALLDLTLSGSYSF
jgi:hypothetical protein